MNVDAWSPSTFSVVEGCMESNPVLFTWSRDLYRQSYQQQQSKKQRQV